VSVNGSRERHRVAGSIYADDGVGVWHPNVSGIIRDKEGGFAGTWNMFNIPERAGGIPTQGTGRLHMTITVKAAPECDFFFNGKFVAQRPNSSEEVAIKFLDLGAGVKMNPGDTRTLTGWLSPGGRGYIYFVEEAFGDCMRTPSPLEQS
jgi:hypothetical protein